MSITKQYNMRAYFINKQALYLTIAKSFREVRKTANMYSENFCHTKAKKTVSALQLTHNWEEIDRFLLFPWELAKENINGHVQDLNPGHRFQYLRRYASMLPNLKSIFQNKTWPTRIYFERDLLIYSKKEIIKHCRVT